MNKKVIMANIAAIMASNIALAGQGQSIKNPIAKPPKAKSDQMAYGCFKDGRGKIGCEGGVSPGCIGSGSGREMPSKSNGAGTNPDPQGSQGAGSSSGSGNGSQQNTGPIDRSSDDALN